MLKRLENRFKDFTVTSFFILVFVVLAIVYFPTFFNPPRSDWWESLYFFHSIYASDNPFQWMHILNTDCIEHVSYRPFSHLLLYMQHFIFGSNFIYINIINSAFYCLSLLLLYRFSLFFINSRDLAMVFIGAFSLLFSHFDIVAWSAHCYLIAGFCSFVLAFIVYFKFLNSGRNSLLFIVCALFLFGMFCYEAFILWPLSVIILSRLPGTNNSRRERKGKLKPSVIISVGLCYFVYFAIFLLTRAVNTYGDSWFRAQSLISELVSIHRIFETFTATCFNILYNGFFVNIFPALANPVEIASRSFNIQMGGFLITHRLSIIDMQVSAIIVLVAVFLVIVYLRKMKLFEVVRLFLFLLFLLLTFTFVLLYLKYFSNKEYLYNFLQFRYQFIPNAIIFIIVLLLIDKCIILTNLKRKLILTILLIVIFSNLYYTISGIWVETAQLKPLSKILVNIKNEIKRGGINPSSKLYIDNGITKFLPPMCWNPEIGSFMKGTYQWLFDKNEISYFSDTIEDATWVVDTKNLGIVRKTSDRLIIQEGDK